MPLPRWMKRRSTLITAAIVVVLVLVVRSCGPKPQAEAQTVAVEHTDLLQTVSVVGTVKAADRVELAFERGGRLMVVGADVGSHVIAGQVLMRLDAGTLPAQLRSAQATAEAERVRTEELRRGTRPEELAVAQTKVANAEVALAGAEANLANVLRSTASDLDADVAAAVVDMQEAVTKAKSSLVVLTDIQHAHFAGDDQTSIRLAEAKAQAIRSLFEVTNAGRWTTASITALDSGVFHRVRSLTIPADALMVTSLMAESQLALRDLRAMLDAVAVTDQLTSTEKTNLSTEKNTTSTGISNLSDRRQDLLTQEVDNATAITTATTNRDDAQAALANARDALALAVAGSTPEAVAAQAARWRAAEATAQSYAAQLAQTVLHAPFAGVVTRRDARVGELVTAGSPVLSLISEAAFEIETFVPEADIAKLQIGDTASTTLDAYGDREVFVARITSIDPAETVVEGVSTYRVIAQFVTSDERIKSGMTANLDIETDRRTGVLAIPLRTLGGSDRRSVRVKRGQTVETVTVEVGLRGSDGHVEIVSGLSEGDRVVVPE